MGIAVWAIAGLISFSIARFIEIERRSWFFELAVSVISGLVSGVIATALDFGGWATADGRAFAFCGLVALLVLGILRSVQHGKRHSEARS